MYRTFVGSLVSAVLLASAVAVFAQEAPPEEARRFMARGMAAVELAKTPQDYGNAIAEFEQAAKLAPDWPDVYFNLGTVQAKAQKYGEAVRSLKRYIELAPDAPDAAKIQNEIYKLEYMGEQRAKETALNGPWSSGRMCKKSKEEIFYAVTIQDGIFTAKEMPTACSFEQAYTGTIDGTVIKGVWSEPEKVYLKKNGKVDYRFPALQAEFTGTINAGKSSVTLRFIMPKYVVWFSPKFLIPASETPGSDCNKLHEITLSR